jgi:hypothetical protein
VEQELIVAPEVPKEITPKEMPSTPMGLLSLALQNNAAIDVIERLAALQEKAVAKQSEQSYFRALHMAQEEVPSIEPNKEVKTSSGKLMYSYASYEQLDKALRPIYIKYGMAISFSGAEAPAGKVRVLCCVSHRDGHSERYQLDLAIDQGAAQLTKTDAELAAQSKAKRRILRNIFNIVDDIEDEGDVSTNGEVMQAIEKIMDAGDKEMVTHFYKEAYKQHEADANAIKAILEAKHKRMKQIGGK